MSQNQNKSSIWICYIQCFDPSGILRFVFLVHLILVLNHFLQAFRVCASKKCCMKWAVILRHCDKTNFCGDLVSSMRRVWCELVTLIRCQNWRCLGNVKNVPLQISETRWVWWSCEGKKNTEVDWNADIYHSDCIWSLIRENQKDSFMAQELYIHLYYWVTVKGTYWHLY